MHMPAQPSSFTPPQSPAPRCTYFTLDSRRCTAPVFPGHTELCHQHLRRQLDGLSARDDIATDIITGIQNFQSAATVNAALGRILILLASGRIKRQDAIAMSYICQLMLQSLKGFKQEISLTTYEKTWERDLVRILNERTPLNDFVFPSVLGEDEAELIARERENYQPAGNEQKSSEPENQTQEITEEKSAEPGNGKNSEINPSEEQKCQSDPAPPQSGSENSTAADSGSVPSPAHHHRPDPSSRNSADSDSERQNRPSGAAQTTAGPSKMDPVSP